MAGLASMISCSEDPVVEELVVPAVFSVSDTELIPGDTLYIVGENFAEPATGNRVVFNNELATPRPFYKRWWFWAAIGVGTLIAIDIATGDENAASPDLDAPNLSWTF